jgi:hypothetical protein
MGAEAAAWVVDGTGHEAACCCFDATLREWARLALLLANDGNRNGRQIIPTRWVVDAPSVKARWLASRVATPYYGYG